MLEASELWAKTGPSPEVWHSLPCHLLDVAACAEALWDSLPPDFVAALAENLQITVEEAKLLACFLAGSHDTGKANPFFQAKSPDHGKRLAHWGLSNSSEPEKHGQATYAFLVCWLMKRWGWQARQAAAIASAVGGHHGRFFSSDKLSTLEVKDNHWQAAADSLLDWLAQVLGVKPLQSPNDVQGSFPLWLAGFVSVADWLGSHERMVSYDSGRADLTAYLASARARAKVFVSEAGFRLKEESRPLSINDLLPAGAMPNEMQLAAERLAGQDFRFVLIEAPTGEGKTEGSLTLAEWGRSTGRGISFLLPTMATANGLVPRIDQYLQSSLGADVHARLLHSGAWLYVREGETVVNPDDQEQGPEAEDWFAGSKRGLLDRFGVGTIDQALMGALKVKHFFVRLFALAGKTVVVDEVHAYDVYMGCLMDVLLAWLKALDCRVILLSATLPSARRQSLLEAWGCAEAPKAAYPRITSVLKDGSAQAETFSVKARKPLRLTPLSSDSDSSIEEAIASLLESIKSGAKTAALIVNTVSRAQRAFQTALGHAHGQGIAISLFHARLTMEDRQAKESSVLNQFGKKAERNSPRLLIATQVVEQSLDLDFDAMISDLAPVDLLIQRAGRLHRHNRDAAGKLLPSGQPDQRANPVLQVLIEEQEGADQARPLRDQVYSAAILQQTKNWLSSGQVIAEPSDVESAIEAVYGTLDPEKLQGEADRLLTEAVERMNKGIQKDSLKASEVVISRPNPKFSLPPINRMEDEENGGHALSAKTRLETLPSLNLIVWPYGQALPQAPLQPGDKRALALKQIRVAAHGGIIRELLGLPLGDGWSRVKALAGCRLAQLDAQGFFETDSYRFHYSSETGLFWETKNA